MLQTPINWSKSKIKSKSKSKKRAGRWQEVRIILYNPLNRFVSRISVISFAEKEAAASATVRAKLESKGTPIGPLDILIAGTALNLNAILVTHNTKEFERVDGLQIEDWF